MTLLTDPPVWAQLVMLPLAAWRVAVLLSQEGGPGGVFRRLRSLTGIQHDDDGNMVSWPERLPATLFVCVWCLSFWTTVALCGILLLAPGLVVILGSWGVATYLEAHRNGR